MADLRRVPFLKLIYSGDWIQLFTRKRSKPWILKFYLNYRKNLEFTVLQENLPCRPWNFFQEKKYFLKFKKMGNQVRRLSNSDKKQKCIDELKGHFTPCPMTTILLSLRHGISNNLLICYCVVTWQSPIYPGFHKNSMWWTNKTLLWMQRYLSRGNYILKIYLV